MNEQFYKTKGDFYCSYNKLTNLIGCPKIVNGIFAAPFNEIESLEEIPESIGGAVIIISNFLPISFEINDFDSLNVLHKIHRDKKLLERHLNYTQKKNISIRPTKKPSSYAPIKFNFKTMCTKIIAAALFSRQ